MKEEFNLTNEELLESRSQQSVRLLVAGLKDDEPNMSWRSALNEQILVVATRSKAKVRRLRWIGWGSSLGFGSAVVAFSILTSVQPVKDPMVADSKMDFISIHQDSTVLATVSGFGNNEQETGLSIEMSDLNAGEEF
jgi:hypothetical protein